MAGFGPPPSETKRRRNKDTFEDHKVEVPADAVPTDVPELPDRDQLHPDTVRWWDTWVQSPVTTTWLSTDWDVLRRLVKLVEAYNVCSPHDANNLVKLETAIRQRESLLGATHVDRMRARIKVGEKKNDGPRTSAPEKVEGGKVAHLDDRRDRRARLLAGDA